PGTVEVAVERVLQLERARTLRLPVQDGRQGGGERHAWRPGTRGACTQRCGATPGGMAGAACAERSTRRQVRRCTSESGRPVKPNRAPCPFGQRRPLRGSV